MGRYSIDWTAPETIKLLAELPFHGQADVIVRGMDPLWKTEIGEPREWEVLLEKWHGCNCCYCEPEHKSLRIDALTGEEAGAIAEGEWPEWEVSRVRLPEEWRAEQRIAVPEEFYEKASTIWDRRHAQGTEAQRAETVKQGSVHDGPVPKECAQTPPDNPVSGKRD